MKQTAVEWLIDQLEKIVFYTEEAKENTIKQAKEMEKQQIVDAWFGGYLNGECKSGLKSEQYYKETFNK